MNIGHPILYRPPIALTKTIDKIKYTKHFSTPANVLGILNNQNAKAIKIKFCTLRKAENAGIKAHVALNKA